MTQNAVKTGQLLPRGGVSAGQAGDVLEIYGNSGLMQLLKMVGIRKTFTWAQGCTVRDSDGKEYIDCLGGYGCLPFGHRPKSIINALVNYEGPNYLQTNASDVLAELNCNLAQITPGNLQNTFVSNDGTEAVEAAIKAARKATGRTEIITALMAFHGKTYGSLSAMGGLYAKPFGPLLPGCKQVLYGDLDALKKVVNRETALVILEPIQGEGGIIIPPDDYLQGAEEICHKAKALIAYDEVQTGFGRTGKLFGCQLYADSTWQPHPDIMCLAKALGGGVMPIGATIFTNNVWEKAFGGRKDCLIHTSTFGGGGLACVTANEALHTLFEGQLISASAAKGKYLMNAIDPLRGHPLIADIRGAGLLVGIELKVPLALRYIMYEAVASLVIGFLLKEHGVIVAYTLNRSNVIRLEPPLTISYAQMDTVVGALFQVFEKYQSATALVAAAAKEGWQTRDE